MQRIVAHVQANVRRTRIDLLVAPHPGVSFPRLHTCRAIVSTGSSFNIPLLRIAIQSSELQRLELYGGVERGHKLRFLPSIGRADARSHSGTQDPIYRLRPEKASARALGSLQLAAELPMSQAHLSRIELGDHAPPSDAVLLRIAEVLSIDPRKLLRAAGRQAAGVTFETIVLDQLDQLSRAVGDLRSNIEHIERQLGATAPPSQTASTPKR